MEVEKWKPLPPKDPILLKRLTPNLFGVLATWDLTNLERAIIRGRILTWESLSMAKNCVNIGEMPRDDIEKERKRK